MKIEDVILEYISGDWGTDEPESDDDVRIRCIRGADITDVNEGTFLNIPVRYVTQDSVDGKALMAGDIVIEKSGGSPTQSTGRVSYISDDCIGSDDYILCSNFCAGIRIKKGWNPKFVFYYLQYVYDKGWFFNFEGKTSGIKNLQMERAFSKIPMPECDIQEQDRIVEALSNIEKKMVLNRRINTELEKTAKEIYDYWFVQYDFPDKNGKPYKTSGGAMEHREETKTEIPKGWNIKELGKECTVLLGGTPSTKKDEYWNGDIPWLSSGEMASFPVVHANASITEAGLNNSATKLLPAGTVATSITRYIRPTILGIDSCANQSVVGILESRGLKKAYLYPYLINRVKQYLTIRTGNQQPHINKGIIEDSPIVIPPDYILEKYYDLVASMYETIIKNAKEIDELEELRNEVLPLFITGQLAFAKND